MSDRRLGIDFHSVAVIGRGLIGGSIELALRSRLPEVPCSVFDRNDDFGPAAEAGLVILCAPVRANIEILDALRGSVAAHTLITDVSSTKAAICAASTGLRFIGGHPIAGSARAGHANARADLFVARPWILTRGGAPPEDEGRLERFVAALGAQPAWLAPGDHDRLFAFISHLPQLTISALMDVVTDAVGEDGLRWAGDGLRDSTRLADSPPDIWTDVLATNGPALRAALDALIGALSRLRDDGSGAELAATFRRAASARAKLPPPL